MFRDQLSYSLVGPSFYDVGGIGIENWPNLLMDSSKKLPTVGVKGKKSWKFANVPNTRQLQHQVVNSKIAFEILWFENMLNE